MKAKKGKGQKTGAPKKDGQIDSDTKIQGIWEPSETTQRVGANWCLDNELNRIHSDRCDIFSFLPDDGDLGIRSSPVQLYLSNQIQRLLGLKFAMFWAEILQNNHLQQFLDSFLVSLSHNAAKRMVDEDVEEDEKSGLPDPLEELSQNVLLFYLRLTHRSEGDVEISAQYHQSIIYDHWLFDVAKIFDLAVVYGETNPDVVSQIFTNLFTEHPHYLENVQEGVLYMIKNIKGIPERTERIISRDRSTEHLEVVSDMHSKAELIEMSLTMSLSLNSLLRVMPHDYLKEILSWKAFGHLSNLFSQASTEFSKWRLDKASSSRLTTQRLTIKSLLVDCFDILLHKLGVDQMEASNPHQLTKAVEYVSLIIELMRELAGKSISKEAVKPKSMDFLKSIWRNTDLSMYIKQTQQNILHREDKRYLLGLMTEISPDLVSQEDQDMVANEDLSRFSTLTQEEITIKISHIQEICPETSQEFLSHCLQQYDCDAEKIIHDILEGKLSQEKFNHRKETEKTLNALNKGMDGFTVVMPTKIAPSEKTGILDNDEMDQKLQQGDLSNFKVKKDTIGRQQSTYLDEFYKTKILDEYNYEDEYDDTYDFYQQFNMERSTVEAAKGVESAKQIDDDGGSSRGQRGGARGGGAAVGRAGTG
eukprot:CAMPEP_0114989048 /NCGR_PEP_ID=MMETSP0216-20121206/9964_1 /TAXON_ID=223996 /ORGANISM="Protocruzia adherens, Strain Boccale" /LENGTH=645 /DNA_ID=CAMNT_0002351949 /DNA_START=51 /DNA_END=1985 /DNA_ORIENTATION=+